MSRAEPMIDLLAISAIDRDTEISYVRRERDWLARAQADGRDIPRGAAPADAAGRSRADGNGAAARRRPATRWRSGPPARPRREWRFRETVPYLGWRWDDLVFLVARRRPAGSALLVVLGRDIIRSGLWLRCSRSRGWPASTRCSGATLMAAAQVLVYMGAISVLILFAIMLTQSKSRPGAPRLPAPVVGRRASRPSCSSC